MSDKLIAYYSRTGENYINGGIRWLDIGNTEKVVKIIQKLTKADVFEIKQVKEYSKEYMLCTKEAKKDIENNARPELLFLPESIDNYDEIYLCYPNYWGTMPMAVFTFIESLNLDGKIIKPLCTHEGSGMGKSEKDLKRLCPKSYVKKGLALYGAYVDNSENDIVNWL